MQYGKADCDLAYHQVSALSLVLLLPVPGSSTLMHRTQDWCANPGKSVEHGGARMKFGVICWGQGGRWITILEGVGLITANITEF